MCVCVDYLSPLHLVVLLGFYLVPSSGTYSSAVSFYLTFCDCGFCSAGCSVIVFLSSAVCPLLGEAVGEACAGFLVEGTVSCPLVGRAGSCSSGGQGQDKGCV